MTDSPGMDAAAARRGFRWLDLVSETERVSPGGAIAKLIALLSLLASLAIAWFALFGTETQHFQVANLILLIMPIAFLTTTPLKGVHHLTWIDYLLAVVSVATGLWFMLGDERYQNWMSGFSSLDTGDVLAGVTLCFLTVELCRRTIGPGLTVVVAVLLAYVAFGHLIGGSFNHPPVSLSYFLEMQVVGTDGIFGSPLYVAASYAFLFVLFGNLFVLAGGGQLFFDLSAAATGRMVGGPAKACVMSSALYGSISGSPVADVATTGPVSIPIMRRIGMPAERAGAIEATSSTGGAVLPPVMGAVAFMMADFTGISYNLIAAYATIPCLIFYLGILALVHFEARKLDLGRVPEEDIVGWRVALQRNWTSLLPCAVLVWLLATGYSAAYVAAGSAVATIVCSWVHRDKAIGPKRFLEGCLDTCLSMVPLAGAVAAAGLVIGCIELSGLSGKMTLLLFQLSGGYLIPSLIISGIILVLLGMGMPTTGVYIMGISLLAPVFIVKLHLPMMETHMFMLFYASMSAITPPVAVACFAAASIAKCNPFAIAPYACKLGVGGFTLPFFFLFNPGILLQGSLAAIILDTVTGSAMVLAIALALHGFVIKRPMGLAMRLLFAAGGIAIMVPRIEIQLGLMLALGLLYYALHIRAAADERSALALAAK